MRDDRPAGDVFNLVSIMTSDKQTIAVYDLRVDEYSKAFAKAKADPALSRFLSNLPQGARVLDLGCGPGTHAAAMHAQGYRVTAMDASIGMVELARTHQGVEVRHAEFSDLSDISVFDGVWANFSLLHAPRNAFSQHLETIATALNSNGLFHIGMKTGDGEKRDHLGRSYTFYSAEGLRNLLQSAGFAVLEETVGKSAGLAGTVDPWIEILARLER